jgi:hypothetical protein
MGGLVSSIFDLAEGDPTQTQENQLKGLSNYQTGVGEGLTTAGAGFEEGILSGDPSRIAGALAPEISAGQGQVQQQALTNANFGNRGGGTNASTQAATGAERGNIINLVGDLQGKTAGAAVAQGGGILGQASGNIGTEASLATANRQRLDSDVGGIASSAAAIADPFLGGADAGGGGAGVPWYPNASKDAGNAFSTASDDELGADQANFFGAQQPLQTGDYFNELQ